MEVLNVIHFVNVENAAKRINSYAKSIDSGDSVLYRSTREKLSAVVKLLEVALPILQNAVGDSAKRGQKILDAEKPEKVSRKSSTPDTDEDLSVEDMSSTNIEITESAVHSPETVSHKNDDRHKLTAGQCRDIKEEYYNCLKAAASAEYENPIMNYFIKVAFEYYNTRFMQFGQKGLIKYNSADMGIFIQKFFVVCMDYCRRGKFDDFKRGLQVFFNGIRESKKYPLPYFINDKSNFENVHPETEKLAAEIWEELIFGPYADLMKVNKDGRDLMEAYLVTDIRMFISGYKCQKKDGVATL
jgi:hypothetical protein